MDALNPYKPPESQLEHYTQSQGVDSGDLASLGKRFANFILDRLGLLLVGFFGALVIVGADMGAVLEQEHAWWAELALELALTSLFYIGFEGLTHRTPGKWLTGTKVVSADGSEPTFVQIVKRSFSRFIPFEPLSFFFSESRNPTGWHDTLSKTVVIDLRKRRQRLESEATGYGPQFGGV